MAVLTKPRHKRSNPMDTLTIDVRDLPDEKVRELQQKIERWKQEESTTPEPGGIKKRKVDPSEFVPGLTKFKVPLTRALAYKEYDE